MAQVQFESHSTHDLLNRLEAEHAELERRMQERLLDFYMTTADVMPHKPDSRRI